ncbi:DCL family protein [Ralstonia solanacearum]|uniref:DCL family protein n=1 Tax=Ralstonia solanacearum TaxID=305 RepID=UPI0009B88976|nr:DCL family protein [Ralstonia solanacearum]
MAKSVPINLPNGRNWSKKGDAVEHFQAILKRYADGDRVSNPADHDDLAALLKVYDAVIPAGEPTKTGSGVAHFERRPDRDHPGNSSCFFVVRPDGSSIDFSFHRALDVAGAQGR